MAGVWSCSRSVDSSSFQSSHAVDCSEAARRQTIAQRLGKVRIVCALRISVKVQARMCFGFSLYLFNSVLFVFFIFTRCTWFLLHCQVVPGRSSAWRQSWRGKQHGQSAVSAGTGPRCSHRWVNGQARPHLEAPRQPVAGAQKREKKYHSYSL